MSSFSYKAGDYRFLTDQEIANEHSHTAPSLHHTPPQSTILSGVGTLFPPRKGSYAADVDISEDEAVTVQPEVTISHTNHISSLLRSPKGGLPEKLPPTPRLTPNQRAPYLPPSEYPEFERQRLARITGDIGWGRQRGALEGTPEPSPDGTLCTSIEYDFDSEERSAHHDHMQGINSWTGHTTPHHFVGTETSNNNFDQEDTRSLYPYSEHSHYRSDDGNDGAGSPGA